MVGRVEQERDRVEERKQRLVGIEHPSSVMDRPVDADFREVQPLLLLCCRQLGLHPQFERLQGKSLTQIAVHGSLGGRVLPPIHFLCQFSRGLRSLQHRLRYHCFGHSTHRRLSSSALDVLQPLSLEIEGHSAFESSGLYLQLLGYTCTWVMLRLTKLEMR